MWPQLPEDFGGLLERLPGGTSLLGATLDHPECEIRPAELERIGEPFVSGNCIGGELERYVEALVAFGGEHGSAPGHDSLSPACAHPASVTFSFVDEISRCLRFAESDQRLNGTGEDGDDCRDPDLHLSEAI
jgi:hypothetical protein